jgi:hypothetical protein
MLDRPMSIAEYQTTIKSIGAVTPTKCLHLVVHEDNSIHDMVTIYFPLKHIKNK